MGWTSPGISVLLGLVASIFVLAIRYATRPDALPVKGAVLRRDWSPACFGLDLIVASFIAAPTTLALRDSIDQRLEPIRGVFKLDAVRLAAPAAQPAIESFFERSTNDATMIMMSAILAGMVGVSVFLLVVRVRGYHTEVPKGCRHPALRLRVAVAEACIGLAIAFGSAVLVSRVMG